MCACGLGWCGRAGERVVASILWYIGYFYLIVWCRQLHALVLFFGLQLFSHSQSVVRL